MQSGYDHVALSAVTVATAAVALALVARPPCRRHPLPLHCFIKAMRVVAVVAGTPRNSSSNSSSSGGSHRISREPPTVITNFNLCRHLMTGGRSTPFDT